MTYSYCGKFDSDLTGWGQAAKAFGQPLLVEFGAEMNGAWQPWNAKYNGADTPTDEIASDGKPRYLGQKMYRDAHLHIIKLFTDIGVSNITWFFHVNFANNPKAEWNRMAGYYPGDEYMDWIGISVYAAFELGPLTPLNELIDPTINEIRQFSSGVANGNKPLAIAELGAIDYPKSSKAQWIEDAYRLLVDGENEHGPYRNQIKAVSWWDETWWQEDAQTQQAYLQNNSIASSPEAVNAYRNAVSDPRFIEYL